MSQTQFAWLIAATQLGFIVGTAVFAVFGLADRFSTSRVFAYSCVIGALANGLVVCPWVTQSSIWLLRFAVGLCLAGIYPLGMKLIVQWVGAKPASALAWLVGMLTLGTAMPHGLSVLGATQSWEPVLLATSVLAVLAGLLIVYLGDGPYRPNSSPAALTVSWQMPWHLLANKDFRASAFGYFGHMWELYAFWSVVPVLVASVYQSSHSDTVVNLPAAMSFGIVAIGCLGCIIGGHLSRSIGSAKVAAYALASSAALCLLYPLIPTDAPLWRLGVLWLWGVAVVADSPHFSAMSASYTPPHYLGSALLLQNGIGFLITVISILLLNQAMSVWGAYALWLLAPGPLLGLLAVRPLVGRI